MRWSRDHRDWGRKFPWDYRPKGGPNPPPPPPPVVTPPVTPPVQPPPPANAAPVFHLANPLLTAEVGSGYSAVFGASGVPAPTYSLVGAPTWLSVNASTGAVAGTPPTGTTTFSYAVQAANGVATNAETGTYTVTVSAPALTYRVNYVASNATSGEVPVDSAIYDAGQTVTVKANTGNLARTGYTFASWNTQSNGAGLTYAGGRTFTIESGVTLYAEWTAVVVPPPPPPGTTGPSGLSIPGPDAGMKRVAFDDFLTTSLGSMWSGAYNGQSGASGGAGIFLASHLKLLGDSLLRLEAYPDPANALSSWQATAAIAAAVNQWCGAGVQTGTRYAPPFTMSWVCKWDTFPGMTPIVLTMGNTWPPEQDWIEADVSTQGAAQTGYTFSSLYAPGPTQKQTPVSLAGGITDFSQWHLWKAVCTLAGTTLYCDGHQVAYQAFNSAMVSGANGLQNVQFLALQHQTGDPTNPAADGSITSSTPITMYFDSVAIDQPA